jgi:hypothetical protein
MTPETLARIAAAVVRVGPDETHARALREEFAGLHFSFCSDDDVVRTEPVWQGAGFNLYLVDAGDHCLRLTADPARATGILIATVEA